MRIFVKLLYFSLTVFILSFLIIEGLMVREIFKSNIDDLNHKEIDYVVVLGARLYGSIPSPALLERLKTTTDYINSGLREDELSIIVTGGQGENENIPESEAMKIYLVENGVDKENIFIEDKSTSTYENLKFANEIIKRIDNREEITILIVTSDFHIFRSKMIAKRLGFEAYGLRAKTPESVKLKSYFREYFAIIKTWVLDKP